MLVLEIKNIKHRFLHMFQRVPTVDAINKSSEKNYFTYMTKAFDVQQNNSFRVNNAQQALYAYKARTQLYVNDFAEDIIKLNSATSLLVETANTIKNDYYMNTAIKIALYFGEFNKTMKA